MDTDEYRSEVRDGMRIDWDVPVPMPDGTVLRADVFRPAAEGLSVAMRKSPCVAKLWSPLVAN